MNGKQRLPPPDQETPLLPWLLTALSPMSRTRVKELLGRGHVQVNGGTVTQFDHPLKPGDRVELSKSASPRKRDPNDAIVYEDDAVIVIDKPAGLLSVATEKEKLDTAFARLSAHLEERRAGRPFVVHRLDRDTSGLLLFARTPEVRDQLQAAWEKVEKRYLAVVEGTPQPAEGTVRNFLLEGRDLRVRVVAQGGGEAKLAVSRYRVLHSVNGLSLVEVVLETGRKHQIRVHLAGLGCPVAGDKLYGARTDPAKRLALHAWKLAFDHPASGKRVELEAKLPGELKRLAGV